jgi:hypothetical protein
MITVRHPGEVWIRYTNDPKEAPQRWDLRKGMKKEDLYPDNIKVI